MMISKCHIHLWQLAIDYKIIPHCITIPTDLEIMIIHDKKSENKKDDTCIHTYREY